jgi:hypothetical protein
MDVAELFSKHLVFPAFVISFLWFYSGHEYVTKGKKGAGLVWEVVAILVLLAYCVNAIITKSWLSLVAAICLIALQVWLLLSDMGQSREPM